MIVREDRFPAALLLAFALVWGALAIAPRYREDWLLENVLVFLALPVLVAGYRRLRFSNLAYACLFMFSVLHQVGAHYTYSEVPYDAWARALAGTSVSELFGFQRNHYDRLVHFLYGLLVAPAALELVDRRAAPTGLWRWLLAWTFLLSHSTLYELIEAAAAGVFGGDLGMAYLGTQGDVWDAQRDSALAALGATIALLLLRARRLPATDPSTAP